MDLDEALELRLAEIQYPHSWYNVNNSEAWLKVNFYKVSELQKQLVLLPDGYYNSAKSIIKAIERKKHRTEIKHTFGPAFQRNQSSNRYESEKRLSSHHQSFITIHVRIQTSYIPGGGVCFSLGSSRKERIKFSVRVWSLGGTEKVPLLRIVPVERRDGEIITRVFDPIQYSPL